MKATLGLAAVLLLTLWAYRGLQTAGFVYEDHNFGDAITRPLPPQDRVPLGHPRILTQGSLALNARLSRGPLGFHLTNLALHIAVGLVLYALVASWGSPWGGVLAAGLLWLHPMATETVAYISSGRGELVATLVALLALWASDRGTWLGALLCTLCGLIALAAKDSTAAGLVALVPLLAWWRGRSLTALTTWVPVAVWVVVAELVWSSALLGPGPSHFHVGANAWVVWADLGRLFLPVGQSVNHARWLRLEGLQLVTAEALWLAVILGTWRWRTARWLVLSLSALLLPRVLMPQLEPPHEHALYFPLVLVAMAVGISVSSTSPLMGWRSVRSERYVDG